MVVLLLIGRRAARDFAADDPVFVGVTRHRPLRVGIEGLLVAPLLDQKTCLSSSFGSIKSNCRQPSSRRERSACPRIRSMNWLRCSGFVSNSTTIMTWLIGVPFSMILGIVAPYATLRQAPVPRTAGDSTNG